MTDLEKVLIKRDGNTPKEAYLLISEARKRICDGEDPEEILYNEFGLEPDYIFDLLP